MEWHASCASLHQKQEYGVCRLQTYKFSQTNNQTTMPCSAQGINCLNQILEEINDLEHRTKGSRGFIGFLIDIWSHPIGSGV